MKSLLKRKAFIFILPCRKFPSRNKLNFLVMILRGQTYKTRFLEAFGSFWKLLEAFGSSWMFSKNALLTQIDDFN